MPNPDQKHRVVTVRSTQTVTVEIDGTVVAKSERPLVLFETGLPPRYYLPSEDVELALFEPTATHTTCPFKGEASYWSYVGPDGAAEARTDVVWGYPEPLDSVAEIAGHLSFYDNVARIHVTGELPAEPSAA
ncbi:DUF427 domain-containing protein [Streptomyces sp. FH025]|uniref:DUF427 domain-containing protein n=1 Tax=Streptomyces sp. FH025 TaxID=2815937 RepID=UPI001A9E6ED6|nr:DUF427 domain-containing protein [Streptomyces sp. FH025]MBO1415053.1 DUF427 domain-containing protein [Streptomyces sp. FH025]